MLLTKKKAIEFENAIELFQPKVLTINLGTAYNQYTLDA